LDESVTDSRPTGFVSASPSTDQPQELVRTATHLDMVCAHLFQMLHATRQSDSLCLGAEFVVHLTGVNSVKVCIEETNSEENGLRFHMLARFDRVSKIQQMFEQPFSNLVLMVQFLQGLLRVQHTPSDDVQRRRRDRPP
jgi:hypothetical protein